MSNELTIIDPKEFGIEEQKGKSIENSFAPKLIESEAFVSQYEQIIQKELNKETFKEARELRLKLVKVRTGIAEVHKSEKAFFLASGKYVDAIKNKLTTPIEQMEEKLMEIEKYEERLEKERKEKLAKERAFQFEPYGTDISFLPLGEMTDEQFQGQLSIAKTAYEAKIEAERKAEEERVVAEKKAEEERKELERLNKLENDRKLLIAPFIQFNTSNSDLRLMSEEDFNSLLSSLNGAKLDYDKKQEEIKLENERLKKEQEQKDKEAEEERKRLQLEAEKAKAEADRLSKEKADKEAKEKAEHEAEEKRKRDLENAGDKEKFKEFYNMFKVVEFPQLKNKEISDSVNEKLKELCKFMVEQSKKLV